MYIHKYKNMKKKDNRKMIHLKFPVKYEEYYKALIEKAESEDRSVSSLLMLIIKEYCNKK